MKTELEGQLKKEELAVLLNQANWQTVRFPSCWEDVTGPEVMCRRR